MDAVWLPVLRPAYDLNDAIHEMTAAKRSAALIENADQYHIVYIGSLLEASDRGATALAQVPEREAVHLLDAVDARTHHVDLIRPLRTPIEYEQLLGSVGRSYAMVSHAHESGLLVTLHEVGTAEASQANTWYCNGPTTHYFPRPLVSVGETCPKCLGYPKGTIFLK